jgi:alanine racemase
MKKELSPFERWMVRSNLQTIEAGADPERIIAILKVNGYPRIAEAVAEQLKG